MPLIAPLSSDKVAVQRHDVVPHDRTDFAFKYAVLAARFAKVST